MAKDHQKTRERAYEIWDREGRQEGRAEEHWAQAERELGGSQTNAPQAANASRGAAEEAGIPAQVNKKGNGALMSAAGKPAQPAQRKRRGAQPLNQG